MPVMSINTLKRHRLSEEEYADRLSHLHEEILLSILSKMPTCYAAQTSLISRRFCDLWKACPVIRVTTEDISDPARTKLINKLIPMLMAAIDSRKPCIPPLHLYLECDPTGFNNDEAIVPTRRDNSILEMIKKAHSRGLRGLTIKRPFNKILDMLPTIFTLHSLEFLSLPSELIYPIHYHEPILPSEVSLPRLRSLSLNLTYINNTELTQLIAKLRILEVLELKVNCEESFSLSSRTIRSLKLGIKGNSSLKLDLPSLESLELESILLYRFKNQFEVNFPLLKNAMVTLHEIDAGDVSIVMELLRCFSHAEDLRLKMVECSINQMPYHLFLHPDKDVPEFVNLKHLEVTTCFHELNCKDVISLLQNSPSLSFLKLSHEVLELSTKGKSVRNFWRSKLPRNIEGNYRSIHFNDLHLENRRKECLKLLSKRLGAETLKPGN